MTARYIAYTLPFTQPILTSRGSMATKQGYYLVLSQDGATGIGECSYIAGLSIDDMSSYEAVLDAVCGEIDSHLAIFKSTGQIDRTLVHSHPSIAFGLETAILDWLHGGKREIIRGSTFYSGQAQIPINGLVWMGNPDYLLQQITGKSQAGWRCIKIKVGAIDFDTECDLIAGLRAKYASDKIEIRLDANGAFSPTDALARLHRLAQYDIHSIEQPIAAGQIDEMAALCRTSPIPIALDEELIGYTALPEQLLARIRPQYIILKPSLLGGMAASHRWIQAAERLGIGWWATSALESNIGLNAIAQWAWSLAPTLPQGLGTGGLYTRNIPSPLVADRGMLWYDTSRDWDVGTILQP
jgi:o-succinylbenzoate synthase